MAHHELALLGHVLRNYALLDVLGRVKATDFSDSGLGVIWEAAHNLRDERSAVSRVTLSALAVPDPITEETTLTRIESADLQDDPGQLADAIVAASMRRKLAATAHWAANAAAEPSIKFAAVLARLAEEVDAIAAASTADDRIGWDVARQVEDVLSKLDAEVPSVPFGIAALDKFTHGLEHGMLTIFAGRPGMGKSAALVSFSRRAAQHGHGVLVFSLEMTRDQWLTRMACEITRTTHHPVKVADAVRRKFSTTEQRRSFQDAIKQLAGLPLKIQDSRGLPLAEIRRRIRRARVEFEARGIRLELVMIDQLGNVAPSDRYKGSRYLEIGELTKGLRQAAMQDQLAMLVAHQINRGVESRDEKRPRLSDLRESGDIEQDADTVLFVFREAYYHNERAKNAGDDAEQSLAKADADRTNDELEIIVAKQRHGQTGTVSLWCDIAYNALESLEHAPNPTGSRDEG